MIWNWMPQHPSQLQLKLARPGRALVRLTAPETSAQKILDVEKRPLDLQVAVVLLVFVLGLPVACVASLAIRIPIGVGPVLVAALAAGLVALREGRRRGGVALFIAFGIVLVALALSAAVSDISYDGQAYHQEAVLQLLSGWNPLRGAPLQTSVPYAILLDHYPKFAWMAAATLAATTGSFEAGKALGWLLLIPCLLLAVRLLRERGFGARAAFGLGALVAVSPVVADQLFTFYVDGLLASSLTAAGLLILLGWKRSDRALLFVAALALLFACNLKFTGLVYAAVIVLAALGWTFWRRRAERRTMVVWAGILLIGVAGFGANPYLFNIVQNGNPFFPVAGPGAHDVLAVGPATQFRSRGRLRILSVSLLARTSNEMGATPRLKWPFTIHSDEWVALSAPDPRIGGFGPWFGIVFFVALALLAVIRPALEWWLLIAGVFGSTLITPALFWARLVPQLWLVPVLVVLAAIENRRRLPGRLLAALLGANLLLACAPCLGTQLVVSHYRHSQLQRIRAATGDLKIDFGPFPANRQLLIHARLPFRQQHPLECPHPGELAGSKATYCYGPQAPPAESGPLAELENAIGRWGAIR